MLLPCYRHDAGGFRMRTALYIRIGQGSCAIGQVAMFAYFDLSSSIGNRSPPLLAVPGTRRVQPHQAAPLTSLSSIEK